MSRSHMHHSVVSWSALRAAAEALAKLIQATIEGPEKYHPERHYMRGPGPKWREKHMFDVTSRGA
jgi:hypothetical protein